MADKDFKQLLEEENEKRKEKFNLENTLRQILWDAQVPEDEFNETFRDIIFYMKKCIENEDFKKQLYRIRLDNYKD